ncbi:hypothetical protein VOLCADRAFT_86113 [Volvox carteri f. nagariensis]|uniref:Uncharacterized protein n=1 Tax=Volvox carteri f. nagariensis TaxID=3068 RepID=D8THW7_VOLCA|nr:uncharacterized protein VOLCADRAFT_86113 [Volvox carteri f. nagariensis]EFJ53138.1 hypothetical protein VOLCADRAFT_86113 [Volvox carteri f. nagariensis]|eukprot:XP_002946143.1 hypothetical protein VOLCADRAFT_86113 [Volvox carteri f. nagariensis]
MAKLTATITCGGAVVVRTTQSLELPGWGSGAAGAPRDSSGVYSGVYSGGHDAGLEPGRGIGPPPDHINHQNAAFVIRIPYTFLFDLEPTSGPAAAGGVGSGVGVGVFSSGAMMRFASGAVEAGVVAVTNRSGEGGGAVQPPLDSSNAAAEAAEPLPPVCSIGKWRPAAVAGSSGASSSAGGYVASATLDATSADLAVASFRTVPLTPPPRPAPTPTSAPAAAASPLPSSTLLTASSKPGPLQGQGQGQLLPQLQHHQHPQQSTETEAACVSSFVRHWMAEGGASDTTCPAALRFPHAIAQGSWSSATYGGGASDRCPAMQLWVLQPAAAGSLVPRGASSRRSSTPAAAADHQLSTAAGGGGGVQPRRPASSSSSTWPRARRQHQDGAHPTPGNSAAGWLQGLGCGFAAGCLMTGMLAAAAAAACSRRGRRQFDPSQDPAAAAVPPPAERVDMYGYGHMYDPRDEDVLRRQMFWRQENQGNGMPYTQGGVVGGGGGGGVLEGHWGVSQPAASAGGGGGDSPGLLKRAGAGLGELLRTPLRRTRRGTGGAALAAGALYDTTTIPEGTAYDSPYLGHGGDGGGTANAAAAAMLEGSGEVRGLEGRSGQPRGRTRRRRGGAGFEDEDDGDEGGGGGEYHLAEAGGGGSAMASSLAQLSPSVLKLLASGEVEVEVEG